MKKKILNLLLTTIFLLGIFCVPGYAEDEPDTFVFGKYEQNGRLTDGPEDIEWQILDEKGTKLLLVSSYALENLPFNESGEACTWETSSIRAWLNSEFLETAFPPVWVEAVCTTELENKRYSRGADCGNDTEDKVFLLSEYEADHYFLLNSQRKAQASKMSGADCDNDGYCWWMLRTMGNNSTNVMGVHAEGGLNYNGRSIDEPRAIRPAIWLDIAKLDVLNTSVLGDMYYYGSDETEQDFTKAFEYYKKAAIGGDAYSMNNLATMYYNGEGVEKNYTIAIEWFTKAAELGDKHAMDNLGCIYLNGEGTPLDYSKAMEWFKLAVEHGNTDSVSNMGIMYRNGFGVKQDYSTALNLFEIAAEAGSALGMFNLASMYHCGYGVDRNLDIAMDWYKKGAALGDEKCIAIVENPSWIDLIAESVDQINQDMPSMNENEDLFSSQVQTEIVCQREWYEEPSPSWDIVSISHDSSYPAPYKFANMSIDELEAVYECEADSMKITEELAWVSFEIGHEYQTMMFDHDYEKAAEWYEKAVEAGDFSAMNNLAVLYYFGNGVPQNYTKAAELYERAAASGNISAINNLGKMHVNGLGVKHDFIKAKSLFEKAANKDDTLAMFYLGNLYENERFNQYDYFKAEEWYEMAAAAGSSYASSSAMNNLGVMYENGQFGTPDYAKAILWYEKAAETGSANAMKNLGVLYKYGLGVEQDYIKAAEWIKKGHDLGAQYTSFLLEEPEISEAVKSLEN